MEHNLHNAGQFRVFHLIKCLNKWIRNSAEKAEMKKEKKK